MPSKSSHPLGQRDDEGGPRILKVLKSALIKMQSHKSSCPTLFSRKGQRRKELSVPICTTGVATGSHRTPPFPGCPQGPPCCWPHLGHVNLCPSLRACRRFPITALPLAPTENSLLSQNYLHLLSTLHDVN